VLALRAQRGKRFEHPRAVETPSALPRPRRETVIGVG
jgi:hypothetical protein